MLTPQSLEKVPWQLQYEYDTFNCLKLIQSIKELTKCKEIKQYEDKIINRVLQANIQQAYFLILSSKYKFKIYKEKDLFFTSSGKIVFLSFQFNNNQKLAKIMNQVNLQNLFYHLQELIQKMNNKLKNFGYSQILLLEEWKELFYFKRKQYNQANILNSEIIKGLKNLNIFQKNSLKARIQGSILINKFDQIEIQDLFYLKKHFLEFKEIMEGCYKSFQQKYKQKNIKMGQILIDLSKCRFFQCSEANKRSQLKFPEWTQNQQIQYLKQSFIICLQICDSQSKHIKYSHQLNKQNQQKQSSKDSQNHKSSQKQQLYFKICFIGSEAISIIFQTNWKISQIQFKTQFKKKIKNILKNVVQTFLTHAQSQILQLQDFDLYLDSETKFIFILSKTTVQKNQLSMYTILKVIDQLVSLYLALVKISIYYQILSFDILQCYALSPPTEEEECTLVKNIHGYWGLLYLKYQSLKGSFSIQQTVIR